MRVAFNPGAVDQWPKKYLVDYKYSSWLECSFSLCHKWDKHNLGKADVTAAAVTKRIMFTLNVQPHVVHNSVSDISMILCKHGPQASLNMSLTFFHWPDVSVVGQTQSDVILTTSADTFLSLVFQFLRFPLLNKQIEINILSFLWTSQDLAKILPS